MNALLEAIGWFKKPPTPFDESVADAPTEDVFESASDDDEEDEDETEEIEDEEAEDTTAFSESTGEYEYQLIENGLYWLRDKRNDGDVWLLATQDHPAVRFCFSLREREVGVIRQFQDIEPVDVAALQRQGGIVPGVLGYFVEEKLQADADFSIAGTTALPPVEPYAVDGEDESPADARSVFASGVDTRETYAQPSMHLRRFVVAGVSQPGVFDKVVYASPGKRTIWYTIDVAYYGLYLAAREKWLHSASLVHQLARADFSLPAGLDSDSLIDHLRQLSTSRETKTSTLLSSLDRLRHTVSVAVAADELTDPEILSALRRVEAALGDLAIDA